MGTRRVFAVLSVASVAGWIGGLAANHYAQAAPPSSDGRGSAPLAPSIVVATQREAAPEKTASGQAMMTMAVTIDASRSGATAGGSGAVIDLWIEPNCKAQHASKRPSPATVTLSEEGKWSDTITLPELPPESNHCLWAQIQGVPPPRPGHAVIRSTRDPCAGWRWLTGLKTLRQCVPFGIHFLRSNAEEGERPQVLLEVRRAVPKAGQWSIATDGKNAVVGTRGATGVAWDLGAKPSGLLVTIGPEPPATPSTYLQDPASPRLKPGLYRIPLAADVKAVQALSPLATPGEDETLTAPFVLGDGRLAYVRERGVRDAQGAWAILVVERVRQGLGQAATGGKTAVQNIPLRRTVHQLLAYDRDRDALVFSSRKPDKPAVFAVVLGTGEVTELDTSGRVYATLMLRPGGKDGDSVIAKIDASGNFGWEVKWLDAAGKSMAEQVAVPGHDLLPAWRPDGQEIVYLGQVGARPEP